MLKYIAVFAGGGLGAVLRFMLSRWVGGLWNGAFPMGTLTVNLAGCLVIGFLAAVFEKWVVPPDLRLFCTVGVLGGFTTFSSFGLETVRLFQDREIGTGVVNVLVSNLGGLALVFAGFFLARWIFKTGGQA